MKRNHIHFLYENIISVKQGTNLIFNWFSTSAHLKFSHTFGVYNIFLRFYGDFISVIIITWFYWYVKAHVCEYPLSFVMLKNTDSG